MFWELVITSHLNKKNMSRRLIFGFLGLMILSLVMSCEKDYIKDEETETETENDSDGDQDNTAGLHEDSTDYVWNDSDVIPIVLNGSSVTVNNAGVTVTGSIVTITKAATYSITGALTNGQLVVNTEDDGVVRLILSGAQVANSTTTPFLISKSKKVVVYLQPASQNTLSDATTYAGTATTDPNACIYSKSNLTICGSGSLTIKGNYKDGIQSKDGLIIRNSKLNITAVDDGICGKDYLYARGANIIIKAGGDGFKSDNTENAALGYITLSLDTLDVTSGGDAISAQTNLTVNSGKYTLTSGGGSSKTVASTLSAKGVKADVKLTINGGMFSVSSADDAVHTNGELVVNGGEVTVASSDDGFKAESSVTINNGTVSITKSYEGIESPSIKVNDGNISIIASNDCFNATKGTGSESSDGSLLAITGGNIYLNVTSGDGLDSNGNISISGGTILVHGPQSSPEVGMDYNGTCTVTGGFLVISGTNSNMTQAPSTSSTQYSVRVIMTSSLAANTIFHIQNAAGNDILTFKPARSYYSMVFSSSSLKSGNTYYIYTGGSCTGTLQNGLYTGGTYSGGTLYGNFTVSSSVTSLGSATGGGGRPGG